MIFNTFGSILSKKKHILMYYQPEIEARNMPREMPEVTKINAPNPAHLRAVTLPVSEGTITLLLLAIVLLYISSLGENFFPLFIYMAI